MVAAHRGRDQSLRRGRGELFRLHERGGEALGHDRFSENLETPPVPKGLDRLAGKVKFSQMESDFPSPDFALGGETIFGLATPV